MEPDASPAEGQTAAHSTLYNGIQPTNTPFRQTFPTGGRLPLQLQTTLPLQHRIKQYAERNFVMTEEFQNRQTESAANDTASSITGTDGVPEPSKPFKIFATQEEYQQHFDRILGQRLKNARKTAEKLEQLESLLKGIWPQSGESDKASAARHGQGMETLTKELADLAKQDSVYDTVDPAETAADPKFLALLSQGFTVKEAYDALHLKDVTRRLAEQAEHRVICNIMARGSRPPENAAAGSTAGTFHPDVAAMNNDEIDAVLERVQRGESISF